MSVTGLLLLAPNLFGLRCLRPLHLHMLGSVAGFAKPLEVVKAIASTHQSALYVIHLPVVVRNPSAIRAIGRTAFHEFPVAFGLVFAVEVFMSIRADERAFVDKVPFSRVGKGSFCASRHKVTILARSGESSAGRCSRFQRCSGSPWRSCWTTVIRRSCLCLFPDT